MKEPHPGDPGACHYGVVWKQDAPKSWNKAEVHLTPIVRVGKKEAQVVPDHASDHRARLPLERVACTPQRAIVLALEEHRRQLEQAQKIVADLETRLQSLVALASEFQGQE